MGDKQGATEAYEKAAQLRPDDSCVQNALGYALRHSDRPEESIEHFEAAARADPRSTGPPRTLAWPTTTSTASKRLSCTFGAAWSSRPGTRKTAHGWSPTLRRYERAAAGARALDETGRGAPLPSDAGLLVSMMEVAYKRGRYAQSAELGLAAFTADPALANEQEEDYRYFAACSAALAGCGRGDDAATLDAAARARWRKQALTWLREDLSARSAGLADADPAARSGVCEALDNWQQDGDLARLRDEPFFAEATADERSAWATLWQDVGALLQRTRSKSD